MEKEGRLTMQVGTTSLARACFSRTAVMHQQMGPMLKPEDVRVAAWRVLQRQHVSRAEAT